MIFYGLFNIKNISSVGFSQLLDALSLLSLFVANGVNEDASRAH